MTTVNTFCGADSIERSTSKVLAPPGGKTSINLGGIDAGTSGPKPVNPCQAARQQSHVFDTDNAPLKINSHQAQRQESHVFEKPQEKALPVHTSSKVLKAPGGGSSIKFG